MGSTKSSENPQLNQNSIEKFLAYFNDEKTKIIRSNNRDTIEKEIELNILKLNKLYDLIYLTRKIYILNNDEPEKCQNFLDDCCNKLLNINDLIFYNEEFKLHLLNLKKGNIEKYLKYLLDRRAILDDIINEYEGMYQLDINENKLCDCLITQLVNIALVYAQINYLHLPNDIITYIKYLMKDLMLIKIFNINYEGIVNIINVVRSNRVDFKRLKHRCC